MDRISQYKNVHQEALNLFQKKNKDYGDAFANFGPIGVIVRMGDKINRLTNITKSSIRLVQDETIRDTLIDLHNYAAMAVMLLDEKQHKKVDENEKNIKSSASYGHALSNEDVWGQYTSLENF
tara:strand:+ start:1076 stop:1444 length:369 start_codon:yes stop_codon:yes gene_type:complete